MSPARPRKESARGSGVEATPQPEPIPPAAEAAPAPLSTARSIDLDPDDWLWATWRPRVPRPRPEPAPFDLDDCLDRFAAVTRSAYLDWNWNKARISPIMSPQEAHFWLVALAETKRRDLAPAMLRDDLWARRDAFRQPITIEDAVKLIRDATGRVPLSSISFAVNLFPPRDFISLVRSLWDLERMPHMDAIQVVPDWFRRHVLPHLTDSEHRAMQDEVRQSFTITSFPPKYYGLLPLAAHLGAALGLHEEVHRLVRSIPDDFYVSNPYVDYHQRPQVLILGLEGPVAVELEMRRLKLMLKRPDEVRGWLANTEDGALDLVRDSILAMGKKDFSAALLEVLALVKSPVAAAPMLEVMLGCKTPAVAARWLDDHPGPAIPGLIPVAAGRGKLADAALEYLRVQCRRGRADFLRACLDATSPELAEKVRRDVFERVEDVLPDLDVDTTPDWLRTTCEEAKPLKPPGWVEPDALRPIHLEGRKLNPQQMKAVLAALSRSTLGSPHPLIAALKAHADRPSLDAFAWSLFERWLVEGAPSKEKWAMGALGLLGSDDTALKLAPMVRAWPGESQHQRAVFGLECLRAIGTDVALMQLNGIAQKVSFKGLKAKAAEMMEAIATDRGLSRTELEDRIVPDCDLDERGGRIFDFGPRQFRFALGGDMKPMVRDETGKLRDDLPKPGVKDDAAKAAAAVEAWKQLKKQVREVAKVQSERLERAMVAGRRWSPANFESLLVRHPLMINLVRLLVWGGFDEKGRLISSFRVTEERDYADVDEATYRLDGLAMVGIVHPLHLTDAQRSAWGEILGDYEIIPPFPQLGRTVHRLEPEELGRKEIVRTKGIKVPAFTLVGILDRHGWSRGIPQDAGLFHEHSKPFEGANVTAVVEYGGIPIDMDDVEDQEVKRCFFVPGTHTPRLYPAHKNAVQLGEVDPVVMSEVLGTLGVIASKGK